MATKLVCVTGAAGFIGSHVVRVLLEKGYHVRGTVRDPTRKEKTEHLLRLPNADTHLTLHAADLVKEGSFDEVIKGCTAVFHTASPFFHNTQDGQKELIEPAVNGTLNVFNSIRRVGGVKRIILTSSVAAVAFNGGALPPEHVYTEADWSYVDVLTEKKIYYPLSKTLAEKAAWEFLETIPESEGRPKLVVINPTLVVGPLLQPELNTSSEVILDYLTGKKTEIPQSTMGFVDVRDVALAHLYGLENPEAEGRYLLMQVSSPWETNAAVLRKHFPEYPVPTKVAEGNPPTPMKFDNSKARKLGVPFERSLEDILRDTVESLKTVGLLKPAEAYLPKAGL